MLTRLAGYIKRLKWSDWVFFAIVLAVLVMRAPAWIEAWRLEGASSAKAVLLDLDGKRVEFPPAVGNSVLVFWATWCGPCKVELGRLADASREGKIDPHQVYAITFGEDAELVRGTVAERGYPFRFLQDPSGEVVRAFNVTVTPTVVFLEDGAKISWVTQGLSPSLVLRASRHIK